MKSMTKLMVVAMILVAALVVAPATAARTVGDGNTTYVGENDLILNDAAGGPLAGLSSGYLVKLNNLVDRDVIGTPIRVDDAGDFDLTAAAVGQNTGLWYAFPTNDFTAVTTPNPGRVFIEIPSVSLDVRLGGKTSTTSVNGMDVTRSANSNIVFRINHNLAGLSGTVGVLPANYNVMDVRVTTPTGGTLTALGNQTDLSVPLTGQWNTTGVINMQNVTAGAYTARAVWPSGRALGSEYNSNTVTFNVVSGALAIASDKDTVVRGNSFAVTITGESKKPYWLTITNTTGELSPVIANGQVDVVPVPGYSNYNATVTTSAAGTLKVQFNTNQSTRDASYTIRVTDPLSQGLSTYDEVRVKIEKGSVTVTSSGTGTYYVGEEITLSGTNTDSADVYLFMTGPNLGSRGVGLVGDLEPVADGVTAQIGNFTHVSVEADDTWSFKWDTSRISRSLDSGGYTIYAVSDARDRENVAKAQYDTQTVQLRPGFITATMSSATVAKGDDVTITGTAQGNPSNVNIWIFGKNYYGGDNGQLEIQSVNVESDGTFEHDITGTENLVAGQYFVVVQHPMGTDFEVGRIGNDLYRVGPDGKTLNQFVTTLTRLQAAEAANALIAALESPNVNDAYTKLTFFLEDAWIRIDPVGDKSAGSTFTISGTTNLAAGENLIVEVTSASFQPGQTGQTTGFSSDAGTVTVQAGETANTWSFEVDGTSFRPDQYIVTVESIEASTTATGTFNVIEGPATTQPTGNVTTTPTGTETTPTTTTTTQATPTTTPGFGALLALAGLGAVAFLVLRRD